MSIYIKLVAIQEAVRSLATDKDTKTQYNPGGFKYVTGAKVLDAIKPIMNQHKVLLKQEVLSIENVRQDYELKDGKRKSEILSKVMMRFTWIDAETGERDENLFGANGQNDWDKGVGSALTYGERYFLLKYFHIATDEDDVDAIVRDPVVPSKAPAPVPAKQAPVVKNDFTPPPPPNDPPPPPPLTADQERQLKQLIALATLKKPNMNDQEISETKEVINKKQVKEFIRIIEWLKSK